jgi:hypothetical protein
MEHPTLQTFQKLFESRVLPDHHDPALITPRLEAFRALEKAHKSGDARRIDDMKARLGELAALEMEDLK